MGQAVVLKLGSKQMRVSCLTAMTFLFLTHNTFVRLAGFLGFSTFLAAGILLGLQGLAFVGHLLTKGRILIWDAILLYLAIALVFILTAVVHPEYKPYLDGSMSDGKYDVFSSIFRFGAGIYAYYIFRQYQNRSEELFQLLKVVAVCMFLNIHAVLDMELGYSMDFGYQMEMAALILLANYLNVSREKRDKSSALSLIFSAFAIFLGVLFGSRACVLGYAAFVILTLFFNGKPNGRQIAMTAILAAAVLLVTSSTLMTALYELLKSVGIDSRTIYRLSQGALTTDRARQVRIWPAMREVIRNSTLFQMHGAYADRYYLLGKYVYAHSIWLELWITFGKFFGSLFILCMIIPTVRTYQKNKDLTGIITLLFGCFSIARLWFSSSFWYEPYFWAFLAMLVNARKMRKAFRNERTTEVYL